MTELRTLCTELLARLTLNVRYEEPAQDYDLDEELIEKAKAFLAEPAIESDEVMTAIRKSTPRYFMRIMISTDDPNIDNRIGPAIWSVLDTKKEIFESVSLPEKRKPYLAD